MKKSYIAKEAESIRSWMNNRITPAADQQKPVLLPEGIIKTKIPRFEIPPRKFDDVEAVYPFVEEPVTFVFGDHDYGADEIVRELERESQYIMENSWFTSGGFGDLMKYDAGYFKLPW